jgi:DNA-binding transcriptional regulator LsrR (DeoR family)
LVECEFKGKLYRNWFLDGAPVYTYWLTRDDRIGVVQSFYEAGYTQAKIAAMLQFSATTINKDVKYLRENGELPVGRIERLEPLKVNNSFKIAKLETDIASTSEAINMQVLSRVRRSMAAAQ